MRTIVVAHDGIDLDRSTLSDWVGQAVWLLQPIVAGIRRHVFAAEKLHGADTPVPEIEPGLGRTRTGRLWVYVRDDRPFCGPAPPPPLISTAPIAAVSIRHSTSRTFRLSPGRRLRRVRGALRSAAPRPRDGGDHRGGMLGPLPPPHLRGVGVDEIAGRQSGLDQIALIYAIEDKARFAPPAERLAQRTATSRCSMRSSPGQRQPNASSRPARAWPRRCATSSSAAPR